MRRACVLLVALAGCGGVAPQGDPVAGARVAETVDPTCGACHTLAGAEYEGRTAPDLDELRPGYERVLRAVRDGPGAMPAYDDQLSDAQLHDLAAYVSQAASR